VTQFKWPPARIPLSEKARRACGQELKRRYDPGTVSIRNLMEESGRSYGFVHRALKEAGVQFAPRGNRTVPGLDRRPAQVLRLIADGGMPTTITKDLGVTANAVRTHLTRALDHTGAGKGSPARPAAVHTAYTTGLVPRPAPLPARIDLPGPLRDLIPLLAQGRSVDQIAATRHCPPHTVHAELKKLERALGARSPAHVITRAWQYGLAPTSAAGEEAR